MSDVSPHTDASEHAGPGTEAGSRGWADAARGEDVALVVSGVWGEAWGERGSLKRL